MSAASGRCSCRYDKCGGSVDACLCGSRMSAEGYISMSFPGCRSSTTIPNCMPNGMPSYMGVDSERSFRLIGVCMDL